MTRITREGVWFKPRYGGAEHMIKADTVILAAVVEPSTELYDACKELVREVYTAGDVPGMGLIAKAI